MTDVVQKTPLPVKNNNPKPKKERKRAIVLAIFLGWFFGVQRIYLERSCDYILSTIIGSGVLLLFFWSVLKKWWGNSWGYIPGLLIGVLIAGCIFEIIALMDAVGLLLMTDEEFDELYNRGSVCQADDKTL